MGGGVIDVDVVVDGGGDGWRCCCRGHGVSDNVVGNGMRPSHPTTMTR